MKIGKVELENDLMLAPIAGYTDVGFRAVCAYFGAATTCTEMISAKGLVMGSNKTEELLYTTDYEKVKIVQLFGSEPDYLKKAAEHKALDKFDIIDVNMGCPVPKIFKNGEGSALLNNIELAKDIIKAIKETGKTLTVKIRLGISSNTSIDFVKGLLDTEVDAIAVHGRTREQMYSGKSDVDAIKEIVKIADRPIIANGDIFSKEDYNRIKDITKAPLFMIARGAFGNPKIFSECLNKKINMSLNDTIKMHLDILFKYHNERYVVANFKKHLASYLKGHEDSKALKMEAMLVKNKQELLDIVERIR